MVNAPRGELQDAIIWQVGRKQDPHGGGEDDATTECLRRPIVDTGMLLRNAAVKRFHDERVLRLYKRELVRGMALDG
ncbi:hypothetical protein ColLi_12168 [Colletotrichum liriopes]|uniref:Uncharacterized protein n=1 Tax=Colletotrichum liriopes TaxID=708192 RepID=A0AA37GXW4_9PEZI|nr:hypothetical protein ColLi_12168 [Colletotrichum liriopes]